MGVDTSQQVSACVSHVQLHIWAVYMCWHFSAGVSVSALETHIFPIQARLAIISWLSLWE